MKAKRILGDVFLWVCGSAIFSVSINMFSSPNNIVQGGLTGVATLINYIFPSVPIGTAIFVMNIPLFVLAKLVLKNAFLAKTICATAIYTFIIDLGSVIIPPYKGDTLLACLFCGALSGLGLSLVFMTGATTGGTDIIAMLLRKKNEKLLLGRIMLFLDGAIVLLSLPVYGRIENVMYAVIVIFIASRVIDTVLYGSTYGKVIFIISEKSETISQGLMLQIKRGVTILPVKGGYTMKNKSMILCAVRLAEIRNVLRFIKEKDPLAFTIVCDAGEIIGNGFNNS